MCHRCLVIVVGVGNIGVLIGSLLLVGTAGIVIVGTVGLLEWLGLLGLLGLLDCGTVGDWCLLLLLLVFVGGLLVGCVMAPGICRILWCVDALVGLLVTVLGVGEGRQ